MAARNPARTPTGEVVLFDVIYEDGTQLSNRRVPAAMLGGLDSDEAAIAHIEAEDRRIGQLSGKRRGRIKIIKRSEVRKKAG